MNSQGVPIGTPGATGPIINNVAPLPPPNAPPGAPPVLVGGPIPAGAGVPVQGVPVPAPGNTNRQNRPLFNFPSLRLPNLSDIFGL